MVSIKTALLALAAAVAVTADYVLDDPNSVPLGTRKAWCQSELSTCPLICQQVPPGSTITNTCDPTTLTYGCVCGNNLQPNVSEYTLTMPYFVCTEWGNQCVKKCGGDNTCQSSCRQDHPCGAQQPLQNYTTTLSTAPSSTAGPSTTANQVFDGLGATATPTGASTTDKSGAAALEFGRGFGVVVMAGSLFAGLALVL